MGERQNEQNRAGCPLTKARIRHGTIRKKGEDGGASKHSIDGEKEGNYLHAYPEMRKPPENLPKTLCGWGYRFLIGDGGLFGGRERGRRLRELSPTTSGVLPRRAAMQWPSGAPKMFFFVL
jgi:hypothetical protein